MDSIRRIQEFEHLKILADSRRLTILRLLMANPATLSQLGLELGIHPAQVRHHLKLLEKAGLVEMVDTRVVRGFVEKYYRAQAHAFVLQELILPKSRERPVIAVMGSHDLALDILAERLRNLKKDPLELLVLPVGSLDGLVALRQGGAHLAGCHLLDIESGEYNLPFIRYIFPDRDISVITLAHREQGILLRKGNPKRIKSLEDLSRKDVRMINRNPGSGTRLWFDHHLEQIGLSPRSVHGYNHQVNTHTAVAQAISQGTFDIGLGLRAAASQFDLDFIPLFQERFDLAAPIEEYKKRELRPFFDYLNSADFRRIIDGLGGYQSSKSGNRLLA